MAITNTDLNELLDAIRAGGDIDLVRQGVAFVLQALIDAEATAQIGAERFERTSTRMTQRNGTRDRLLSTKAGDVGLKIPKLRQGSFFPSILERRRRIDRALFAVVMEAYVVTESLRNRGIGRRLIDRVVEEARVRQQSAARDRKDGGSCPSQTQFQPIQIRLSLSEKRR